MVTFVNNINTILGAPSGSVDRTDLGIYFAEVEGFIGSTVQVVEAGDPLPTSDVGPLWVVDESEIYIWDGAAYNAPADETVTTTEVTSSTAALAYDVPTWATRARISVSGFVPVSNNGFIGIRIGSAGSGGAFLSGSDYTVNGIISTSGTLTASSTAVPQFVLTFAGNTSAGFVGQADCVLQNLNTPSAYVTHIGNRGGVDGTPSNLVGTVSARHFIAGNYNAIQLFGSGSNIAKASVRIKWEA